MLSKEWVGQQKKDRDLSFVDIDQEKVLVIACDSAGGIGPKKEDVIKVPGEMIGRFTTRVALMEILAVGAKPISIVNTLAVEYDPTGKQILQGIIQEASKLGVDHNIQINGSTEENFTTIQTGIGVTVVGIAEKDQLKIASSQVNDMVIAVGLPMVGEEVLVNEDLIVELADLMELLKIQDVHEMIPVGSKGIVYEANLLAKMSNLDCEFDQNIKIDLEKSAGPATTLLVSIREEAVDQVKEKIKKPCTIIGKLV